MAVLPHCRNRVRVSRSRTLHFALALAALVATALLAEAALATSRSEKNLPTLNHQVLAAVNRFRAAHGLVALRESANLDRSARQHSLEMGRQGYFAHDSADGTSFWQRIQRYYPENGSSYWSVGENLVWRSSNLSAAQAMSLWIASPPHLANLLSKQWRQIGVSAVGVAHAPGVYGGRRVTIITTDFGVRR
jgi:uncharacterized protein YkwD